MYIQKLLDAEDSDFTNEGAQVEEIQVDGMEGVIITNPDGYNMIALSDNYYVYKAVMDVTVYRDGTSESYTKTTVGTYQKT